MGKEDFTKIPHGVSGVQDRMSVIWERGVVCSQEPLPALVLARVVTLRRAASTAAPWFTQKQNHKKVFIFFPDQKGNKALYRNLENTEKY